MIRSKDLEVKILVLVLLFFVSSLTSWEITLCKVLKMLAGLQQK